MDWFLDQEQVLWANLILFLSGVSMKFVSLSQSTIARPIKFLLSASVSTKTFKEATPLSLKVLLRFFLVALIRVLLLVASYHWYHFVVREFELVLWQRSYLAVIPFFALTYFIAVPVQLLGLLSGTLSPDVHREPWLSLSIEEFWGYRWNRWVHEWFHSVIFRPFSWNPIFGSAAVFALSGLWHEILINYSHHLATGERAFGNMMAYFFFQFVGVWVSRQFFQDKPVQRAMFTWVWIIGPAPVFFHQSTLDLLLL